MKTLPRILKLIFFIVICQGVGAVGALYTVPAIPDWYRHLNRPFFAPPDWIFGPAWTALFFLMAAAAYRISNQPAQDKRRGAALISFFVQLALNAAWPIIFFGFRLPAAAFVEIGFLWLAIFLTTRRFFAISKAAGWLMAPYLAWVSFAVLLNYSFAVLNP